MTGFFNVNDLNPQTLKRLAEDGQLCIIEENKAGNIELVTAAIIIDAPPERVWEVITSFESYPSFMPQVERTRVVTRDENSIVVDFTLKFRFSVISKTINYTLKYTLTPPTLMTWRLLKGDISRSNGAWQTIAIEDGKKTILFYSLSSDLRSIGFLVKMLLEEQPHIEPAIQVSTAILVTKAVKTRVEKGE